MWIRILASLVMCLFLSSNGRSQGVVKDRMWIVPSEDFIAFSEAEDFKVGPIVKTPQGERIFLTVNGVDYQVKMFRIKAKAHDIYWSIRNSKLNAQLYPRLG